MPRRKFTEAEMIAALKQGEAGRTLIEVAREMGVSKHPSARTLAGGTGILHDSCVDTAHR